MNFTSFIKNALFFLIISHHLAQGQFTTETLNKIESGRVEVYFRPSKSSSYNSFNSMSINGEAIDMWVGMDKTIIIRGRNLIFNGNHYLLPEGKSEVWIIQNKVYVNNIGIPNPTPMPDSLSKLLDKDKHEFSWIQGGITFEVEYGYNSCSSSELSKNRWDAIIGDMYISFIDNVMSIEAKEYGTVIQGDLVKISKDRKIVVIKGGKNSERSR